MEEGGRGWGGGGERVEEGAEEVGHDLPVMSSTCIP